MSRRRSGTREPGPSIRNAQVVPLREPGPCSTVAGVLAGGRGATPVVYVFSTETARTRRWELLWPRVSRQAHRRGTNSAERSAIATFVPAHVADEAHDAGEGQQGIEHRHADQS